MIEKLPPPPVSVPIVDPKTFVLTPIWKQWFVDLTAMVNALAAGTLPSE